MVKFAKRAPFYWRSFLDTKADAFDATRQELMDAHERLMSSWDKNTNTISIKGQRIPLAAINHLFDAAWLNNDTLAGARRRHGALGVYAGIGAGGALGYFGGDWAGRKLIKLLGGKSQKAQDWGGFVGKLLLGALGAGWGAHIANKMKEDSMPSTLDDGTSILRKLNENIDDLYSYHAGGHRRLTGDDAMIADISKPGKAVDVKLGKEL